MISYNALTDKNGYIKIAALDHRDSLKKLLSEDEITKFKNLCVESFSPYVTAVLLDPEYIKAVGENGARPKIGSCPSMAFLVSLEKSGYKETEDGRITETYGDYFDATTAKRIGAVATKLLLYYNTDAPARIHQKEIAKKAFEDSHRAGLPILLEIVTYPYKNLVYAEDLAIYKAVLDLEEYADILKINYCADLDILSRFSGIGKPWVMLSRGMPFAKYKKSLVTAKNIGGVTGFAVGRALWQEAFQLKTWKEKEDFIKTVSQDRIKELSTLFS